MNALLLNDGGYACGLENAKFPTEVDVVFDGEDNGMDYAIKGSELIRLGGYPDAFSPDYLYCFYKDDEFVLIEEPNS